MMPLGDFNARTAPRKSGCIEWTGSLDSRGYGRIKIRGRQYFAHRLVFLIAGVEIPEGMVVDHLCRNPRCVNREHLEIVTPRINTARGQGATAQAIRARLKGKCLNGHAIDATGLYRQGQGMTCAECARQRARRYRARQEVAA